MKFCAVPGCGSNSRTTTNYSFHRLPSSPIPRSQWVLALGPLQNGSFVCSRHFKDCMFTKQGNMKTLIPNAVPKPFLVPSPKDKPCPKLSECSDEAGSSGELVACRVCLAADGRLYAISGSGLEDSLAALTGVALSDEEKFPRHLCVFCLARLSKCAAFRDSCQRSTALLQTLLKRGPLTINFIEAFKQGSQQLTNNLSRNKVFQFGTHPLLEITPQIKSEETENLHKEADFTEVEYLESEMLKIHKASDDDHHHVSRETSSDGDRPPPKLSTQTGLVPSASTAIPRSLSGRHSIFSEACWSDDDGDIDTFTFPIQERQTPKKELKLVKLSTEIPKWKKDQVETQNTSPLSKSDDYHTYSLGKTSAALKTSKERPKSRPIKKIKMSTEISKCKKESKKPRVLSKSADFTGTVEKTRSALKKEEDFAFEKDLNFEIKYLSKEEQIQEMEDKKINSKFAFTCDLCGKGCKKESLLMMHKTFRHNPSLRHECDLCRQRFRKPYDLRDHQEHHRTVFTCKQCGYVGRNRAQARYHYSMHNGRKKLTCPHCNVMFDCTSSYYAHIKLRHAAENEACDECGETFLGKAGLTLHKGLRHGTNDKSKKKHKCTVCDFTFQSEEALKRHTELGAGVSHAALWSCAACGESCGSDAARAAHAAEKHPPGHQRYCKECDKTFCNVTSFERHMDWKHRDRAPGCDARARPLRRRRAPGCGRSGPFICEMCGKMYKSPASLKYHMDGHLGLKPFKCSQCPKAFSNNVRRMLHMRVHTGERPYQCKQCPLAFAARGNYIRHVKDVHLRLQVQAKCDKCGKVMAASSLYTHVRSVHMNIKYVRRKRDRTKKKQDLVTES